VSARALGFRGSLSREQIAVYEFPWPVIILVPLVAILIQIFLPIKVHFFPIVDLPLLVTIFFAVARRNPLSGCITGCVIGLLQDIFAGPHHYIGMYGIALTVVGYFASMLGVKIDVENHGARFLLTYLFFLLHRGVYYAVAHGLLREAVPWSWSYLAVAGLVNAVLAVPVFAFLDRFKQR